MVDYYDQFVDYLVLVVDEIIGLINNRIIPFVNNCIEAINGNEPLHEFMNSSQEWLVRSFENSTPIDALIAMIAIFIFSLLITYRKYVLSFIYKHRGRGREYRILQYQQCEAELRRLIDETNCDPIMPSLV